MHPIDSNWLCLFTAILIKTDWDDAQTDLAHLGGTAPGSAKSGGDKLWEDNWDDDDVEDEFSVQLRWVNSPALLFNVFFRRIRHILLLSLA